MKKLILLGSAAFVLNSCSITQPVAATSNPIGTKVGRSGGTCILGVCLNVDASALTAAQNGGITKISTIDYRTSSILGVVQKHECIVTGE
ncbi:MAG: TRL-like family protein [Flavobacteriales bacterium]